MTCLLECDFKSGHIFQRPILVKHQVWENVAPFLAATRRINAACCGVRHNLIPDLAREFVTECVAPQRIIVIVSRLAKMHHNRRSRSPHSVTTSMEVAQVATRHGLCQFLLWASERLRYNTHSVRSVFSGSTLKLTDYG
jgi:hypothetical protein